MCNKKNEGGRCHAHLKEEISRLSALDSEQSYTSALAAGVSIDKEAFETKLVRIDEITEKAKMEHKQKLQELKNEMLEAHSNALEARSAYENSTLSATDAVEKVKDLFKRQEDGNALGEFSGKENLEEFSGYEHTREYLEAYRYPAIVDKEMRKTREAFQKAREQHEAGLEREVLKSNLELRAQKRRLRYAKLKDNFNSYYSASVRMENEYAAALKGALKGTENSFSETDECKFYQNKIKRLDAEYSESDNRNREQQSKLSEHWSKTGYMNDVTGLHQERLAGKLCGSVSAENAHYEKARIRHYTWKFKKLKNQYVEASGNMHNFDDEKEKQISHLKQRPPLQPEAFKQYRNTVYIQSPEGKAINARITEAKKEIVLTPTYRGQLKAHIKEMAWQGKDVSEPVEKLRRPEEAAQAKGKKPLNISDLTYGAMSRG